MITGINDDGRRLDRVLRKSLPELPLSAIHRLLRKGAVLVDGEAASASQKIRAGQEIMILSSREDAKMQREEQDIKNTLCAFALPYLPEGKSRDKIPEILYEDMDLLVLNKPAGLASHGEGSLEEQVRSYLAPQLPPSLSFKPGPLHRLDKMSTGVIVFSKSLEGARFFSTLMREQKIKKFYLALAEGEVKKSGLWQDDLVIKDREKENTKTAITRVKPLFTNSAYSLVLAEIQTGRTHQIRAQAAARGHPLWGDKKYGGRPCKESFLLHAWRLEFPQDTALPAMIEAPLPQRFKTAINEFFPIVRQNGENIL